MFTSYVVSASSDFTPVKRNSATKFIGLLVANRIFPTIKPDHWLIVTVNSDLILNIIIILFDVTNSILPQQ